RGAGAGPAFAAASFLCSFALTLNGIIAAASTRIAVSRKNFVMAETPPSLETNCDVRDNVPPVLTGKFHHPLTRNDTREWRLKTWRK
ncbi:MAG: hypothetical protein WA322_08515, partial [Pseudolabrys sp.]